MLISRHKMELRSKAKVKLKNNVTSICAIRHNHSKNMGGGAKLDVRARRRHS